MLSKWHLRKMYFNGYDGIPEVKTSIASTHARTLIHTKAGKQWNAIKFIYFRDKIRRMWKKLDMIISEFIYRQGKSHSHSPRKSFESSQVEKENKKPYLLRYIWSRAPHSNITKQNDNRNGHKAIPIDYVTQNEKKNEPGSRNRVNDLFNSWLFSLSSLIVPLYN